MKQFIILTLLLFTVNLMAQVDVTFQVDMTGQTISADGIHIAGNLNGWNTSANMLTNQGNNIYAVTLTLTPGDDYEYKYLNGNAWGTEEAAPSACTIGSNNRTFTAPTSAMTLPVVPFNGCPSIIPTQAVTFSVDMTGLTIPSSGVHVTGNFNGWWTDQVTLSDVGNNIYEGTVNVLSSITTLQYKYLNGNAWGTDETVPAACANANNNRFFNLGAAGAIVDLQTYVFGSCLESLPVPVELTYFKAKKVQQNVLLTWQTASEINNAGFVVERSKDGANWSEVDFVKGMGQSVSIQNYDFLDASPFSELTYYRLRQVDFDGQFEYSNVVIVSTKSSAFQVQVYPNPVINELNVMNASGQLSLYNLLGQPLQQHLITEDFFRLNMDEFASGTYILVIEQKDGTTFKSVIMK